MSFLRSLDINASALTAQRYRMDVIAENIANANTTRTASGEPYRRRNVVFQERESYPSSSSFSEALNSAYGNTGRGVRVVETIEDPSPFKLKYDPTHPDAQEDGYVRLPNVDTAQEMAEMMLASRSYEANVTALSAVKDMAMKALEIGR